MNVKEMIATMQLIGSSVRNLKLSNAFVVADEMDQWNKKIDVEYEINELYVSEKKNIGSVMLHIVLEIDKDGQEGISVELDMDGGFSFIFSEEKNNDEKKAEMEKMLSHNGCATVYSLARAFIVSVTGQMCNGGTIILPMINIYELNKHRNK